MNFLENHGTKIIGYVTIAAGFLATADPALVGELLGDKWQKWALLVAGLLTALRGHQNTAREKAASQAGFARVSLLAVIAVLSFALVGCFSTKGVVERNSTAAQLIVKVAAMKYIERSPLHERGERALSVIRVAKQVIDTAKGEPITLQRLATIAAEQLPATLEPSDRMLAMALISVAQTELQSRIGVGSLESDTLLQLAEVLQWISDAASLYTSPT